MLIIFVNGNIFYLLQGNYSSNSYDTNEYLFDYWTSVELNFAKISF